MITDATDASSGNTTSKKAKAECNSGKKSLDIRIPVFSGGYTRRCRALTKNSVTEPGTEPETEANIRIKRVDQRSGVSKLKDIIFFLKYDLGKEDNELIPLDDVEYAIEEICGLDDRTKRKYLNYLLKFHYLEERGHRVNRTSKVMVKTYNRVDSSSSLNPKEYQTTRGNSEYVFGLFAPRRMNDSSLELCVCERGETRESIETVENVETIIDKKEEENCNTHTYRLSESNINRNLSKEELAVFSAKPCEQPDRSKMKREEVKA